jgi:hypothetical protein
MSEDYQKTWFAIIETTKSSGSSADLNELFKKKYLKATVKKISLASVLRGT